MPITLPPISRRRFIRGAAAAAGALALGDWSFALAQDPGVDHLALLSDTHISSDKKYDPRQQGPMWDHFRRVSGEILRLESRPSAMLINGDCAFRHGLPADYATLVQALEPVRTAGLPVHLGLGNHDSRANIQEVLPADAQVSAKGVDHRIMRVRLPQADWYLLDSLEETNHSPGRLGPEQLKWLAGALDGSADRAAILVVHHQPDFHSPEAGNGLRDTPGLMDVIAKRKQVKAVLFGHTHVWKHYEREGIHFVNLPATAYAFKPEEPVGWVDAYVEPNKLRLTLYALDQKHPAHRQTLDMPWR